ncbi:MAG TPA: SDR family oxidoreductase [Aldersonia sp.]
MNQFEGSVALITGGARGIGAATARTVAARGARVVVADLPGSGGDQVAAEIGGEFAALDVTDERGWAEVVAGVVDRHGRLDVLVNAAGIVGDVVNGALDQISLDDWRKVIAVNLDGTFLGCREAMTVMRRHGRGSIVNLASVGAYYPTVQNAAYGASKGAVTSLTKTVALFGSQDGGRVRCNSVHPGQIATPMLSGIKDELQQRFAQNSPDGGQVATLQRPDSLARMPLGQGQPEDVANLIAFLASEEAGYITGAEFTVDGGWRLLR